MLSVESSSLTDSWGNCRDIIVSKFKSFSFHLDLVYINFLEHQFVPTHATRIGTCILYIFDNIMLFWPVIAS
jgi:hypothetical protein